MINCAIIDDEPLAREGIAGYVNATGFLALVATCESPLEYIKLPMDQQIDLLFLDIQMPQINGLDFLKMTKDPPMVILTTAYSDYALEGYELNVLDYLLKPVTFDRFLKSANKAKDYYQLFQKNAASGSSVTGQATDYFFVRCGTKYEKICFDDVLYIKGMQNYIIIYTSKGRYITMHSLKTLKECYLNNQLFIRVHKSYIIAVSKIESIQGNEIFIDSHRIPISRNYRDQVIQQVVMNKLWDKSK